MFTTSRRTPDALSGTRLLDRDATLRLPHGPGGQSLRVESGLVVVTREGDPEDHVLAAGAEVVLPHRGLAVAWALEPSRLTLRAA